MSFLVYPDGSMELTQGDSGTLVVNGIATDENYKIYFSIYNSKGVIIGDEVWVESNFEPTVIMQIPSTLTDLLVVKGGIDSTEEYYYGIKACLDDTGYEETLCVGDSDIGDLNTITVYPKKVEGI